MSIQAEVQIEAGEFVATQDKGEVSSLLWRPPAARWLLVLGHGASTNMHHRILEGIAGGLATAGIATFQGVGLHLFETADHGFKTLKSSGLTPEQVWGEAGEVVAEWNADLALGEG